MGENPRSAEQSKVQVYRGNQEFPQSLARLISNHQMKSPFVVSVILNTNRRDDTLAVLDSISRNTYPHHQVIVLDNASTDGSIEAIQARFPAVSNIRLERNLGYAGNNNVGIEAALKLGADWVFVLNEDTLLAPDCINRLVEAGSTQERIGNRGTDGIPQQRAECHPICWRADRLQLACLAPGTKRDR